MNIEYDLELLHKFTDYLIKERCQGCAQCKPTIDHKDIVCLEQGEATFLKTSIITFLNEMEDHPYEKA